MTSNGPPIRRTLSDPADMAPYLSDWRRLASGPALLVALPETVAEVVETVNWCRSHGLSIVPQGGNTSLMGGSVPSPGGRSVLLSLKHLDAVRRVDPVGNVGVFEAGVILQNAQEAARQAGRLLPLSLAAEGSCTIGGNLSTNAGGTAVLQYGNARELCLGLEVVTPDGEVLSDLKALRKDNTGLNLRNLFIGAEGTLGIITAAAMRLYPQPVAQLTSYAALDTPQQAQDLLRLSQDMLGSGLTAFEILNDDCVRAVLARFPELSTPFQPLPPYQLLIELSDQESEDHARERLFALLEKASEQGLIRDAAIATSLAQSAAFWALRERVAEAQKPNFKHDISLPIDRIAEFIDVAGQRIAAAQPECRLIIVGHIGDGNLHFNVQPPDGLPAQAFAALRDRIEGIVFGVVEAFNGSISAEHGIGRFKAHALPAHKSASELAAMRRIKKAFDPQGIMNPGVLFQAG